MAIWTILNPQFSNISCIHSYYVLDDTLYSTYIVIYTTDGKTSAATGQDRLQYARKRTRGTQANIWENHPKDKRKAKYWHGNLITWKKKCRFIVERVPFSDVKLCVGISQLLVSRPSLHWSCSETLGASCSQCLHFGWNWCDLALVHKNKINKKQQRRTKENEQSNAPWRGTWRCWIRVSRYMAPKVLKLEQKSSRFKHRVPLMWLLDLRSVLTLYI